MNKKTGILILIMIMILAVCPLLTGAGLFSVGLRNVGNNNPLVNMKELLGGSSMSLDPGTPESEDKKEEDKESRDTDESKDEDVNTQDRETQDREASKAARTDDTIDIKIRGTSIRLNGKTMPEEAFEGEFSSLYDGSKKVVLTDDYADYLTYKSVLECLESKGIKPDEAALK